MRAVLCMSIACLLHVAPAQAGQSCADRGVVVQRLSEVFGERFIGGGYHDESAIFEIWQNSDTGSWTILMTAPDGQTCMMAAGTHWREGLPQIEGVEG